MTGLLGFLGVKTAWALPLGEFPNTANGRAAIRARVDEVEQRSRMVSKALRTGWPAGGEKGPGNARKTRPLFPAIWRKISAEVKACDLTQLYSDSPPKSKMAPGQRRGLKAGKTCYYKNFLARAVYEEFCEVNLGIPPPSWKEESLVYRYVETGEDGEQKTIEVPSSLKKVEWKSFGPWSTEL